MLHKTNSTFFQLCFPVVCAILPVLSTFSFLMNKDGPKKKGTGVPIYFPYFYVIIFSICDCLIPGSHRNKKGQARVPWLFLGVPLPSFCVLHSEQILVSMKGVASWNCLCLLPPSHNLKCLPCTGFESRGHSISSISPPPKHKLPSSSAWTTEATYRLVYLQHPSACNSPSHCSQNDPLSTKSDHVIFKTKTLLCFEKKGKCLNLTYGFLPILLLHFFSSFSLQRALYEHSPSPSTGLAALRSLPSSDLSLENSSPPPPSSSFTQLNSIHPSP